MIKISARVTAFSRFLMSFLEEAAASNDSPYRLQLAASHADILHASPSALFAPPLHDLDFARITAVLMPPRRHAIFTR